MCFGWLGLIDGNQSHYVFSFFLFFPFFFSSFVFSCFYSRLWTSAEHPSLHMPAYICQVWTGGYCMESSKVAHPRPEYCLVKRVQDDCRVSCGAAESWPVESQRSTRPVLGDRPRPAGALCCVTQQRTAPTAQIWDPGSDGFGGENGLNKQLVISCTTSPLVYGFP